MQAFSKIYIPSAAIVSYLVLYFIAFLSKPQNTFKRRFRLYLASMFLWSVASMFVLLDIGNTLIWFRTMTTFALASVLSLYHFTVPILNQKMRFTRFVYIYSIVGILLNQFTSLVTPSADIVNGSVIYEFTPFMAMVAGPNSIILFVCIYQLMRSARISKDETQVTRFTLFVLAIIMVIIGSSLNLTKLGQYPVDIAANVIAAFILAYAILQHQLLDIKVVFRKSVLYFVPTIIIGAGYFLIINTALDVFHANTRAQLFSTSLIVSVIAALIFQPFRDYIQNWIDRYFFRERYNSVKMLQRVSEAASSVIDLDQLSLMILKEITEALHIERAALFLRQNNGTKYFVASQLGMKLPPRTVIASDHPIVEWLYTHDHIVVQQDLDMNPRFMSMWGQERELIKALSAEVHVPLIAKGELLGFMPLGPKLSGQLYSSEDKQILLTLSHQIAVAVQNAQLYSTAHQEIDPAQGDREKTAASTETPISPAKHQYGHYDQY